MVGFAIREWDLLSQRSIIVGAGVDGAVRVGELFREVGDSASKMLNLPEEGPSVPDITLSRIDSVIVGYGQNATVFESWGNDVGWWTTVPPQKECRASGFSTRLVKGQLRLSRAVSRARDAGCAGDSDSNSSNTRGTTRNP